MNRDNWYSSSPSLRRCRTVRSPVALIQSTQKRPSGVDWNCTVSSSWYSLHPRSFDDPNFVVQQGYDTCAPKYLAWQSARPAPKALDWFLKLFAHLAPNAHILELGCGPGVPYTQLVVNHEFQFQVTAVDISTSHIALARENVTKSPRVEFVQIWQRWNIQRRDLILSRRLISLLPPAEGRARSTGEEDHEMAETRRCVVV